MYTSVLVITSQHLCDVSLCYMQSDVWDTYSYFSSVAGLSSPIPTSLGHIVLPFDLLLAPYIGGIRPCICDVLGITNLYYSHLTVLCISSVWHNI